MKIKGTITTANLPKKGVRGYTIEKHGYTKVGRAKKAHKAPRAPLPSSDQANVFGGPWVKWRRRWLAYLTNYWKAVLAPQGRTWWQTQALDLQFENYKNISAKRTGFQAFVWYQFRCLDLHLNKYIPALHNAADFPFIFTPPWDPPTLDPPTVLSAYTNGLVTVRCLNITPDDLPVEPWCCFMRNPPTDGSLPIGRHPWYAYANSPFPTYTDYYYDLHTIFPKITSGTYSALIHCYGEPPQEPIPTDPSYPALGEEDGGPHTPWIDPQNIEHYDSAYAELGYLANSTVSNALIGTQFGFAIPTDAQIQGIRLRIYPWTNTAGIYDLQIRLLKAGTPAGENKASTAEWPRFSSYPHVYGNQSDLWDTTWTAGEINTLGFGALMTITHPIGGATVRINTYQITIWYRPPSGWFTTPTRTNFWFTDPP